MLLCAGALVWHCSAREGAPGHACVCACQRPLADVVAGATWARATASAPWAARYLHTTVINAAGPQTVFGGIDGGMQFFLNEPRTYGVTMDVRF